MKWKEVGQSNSPAFFFFAFMGPCIVNVFKHNQQDATLHNGIYYYNAVHVSGGSSAHHQELKTVYTASGICRAFSVSYRFRELDSGTKQKKLDKYPMLCLQF